jgi:hypothetical protein
VWIVARFAGFLPLDVTRLLQVDRALLEPYLVDLHTAMAAPLPTAEAVRGRYLGG